MDELKSSYSSSLVKPFYVGTPPAVISQTGDLLCTPMEDDVVITSLYDNRVLHRIEGDGELVSNLCLTRDGKWLAILSQSQQLRIFKIEPLFGGEDESDAEVDGTVTVNEVKSYKMSSPVYISATDSTSSLFAFGGSDGVVTVWDIEGGYVTHSLKGHGTTICSLEFYGHQGDLTKWRLASGDTMGTAKVWDLVKRKCLITINEHNSAVRGLGFSSDGDRFLTAGRDEIAVVYNEKFKPINTFSLGHLIETAGFLAAEGNEEEFFYTAGSDNIMKVWSQDDGQLIKQSAKPLETNEELVIISISKLEVGNEDGDDEDEEKFLLVLSDQTLVFLNKHLEVVKRIAGNHGTIADLRYVGPEGFDLVALATNSPALRIVDLSKPLEVKLLEGHKDLLNAVDVSSDGLWIASAGKDNEARLWHWDTEAEEFELYAVFEGHAGSVTAIGLPKSENSEVPSFLITGSSDLTIKKWKIPKTTGTIVKTSEYTRRAHEKEINSIDISLTMNLLRLLHTTS